MSKDIYQKAHKRVKQKKGFFTHFGVFVSVGIFFFLMNMLTDPFELWFFFPLLPWSIGLMIHYFATFGLPGTKILTEEWEQEELAKEIQRLKRERGYQEPEDTQGEIPSEEQEELKLKDLKKVKRKEKRWDENRSRLNNFINFKNSKLWTTTL